MDNILENQPELARFSLNMWTPARCQNSALQDEHGQAFYDVAIGTSKGFTPRRSGRLRRAVDYPRDGKISTPKRRKTRKMKNVKTEDLSINESICAIASSSSTTAINNDLGIKEQDEDHGSIMQELFASNEPAKKDDSDLNVDDDIKFTRAIETIEIFDSPIEANSGKKSANSPKTIIKLLKPHSEAEHLLTSSGKKIENRFTPKSVYSAYFSDRTPNAKSSIKKAAESINKKQGSAKSNVTRRRNILENAAAAQSLKKNRSPAPTDGKIQKPLKRLATPKTRIKLPNFTAIHQNQFDKMISIVDDITKKKERAAKAFNFAPDLHKLPYTDRITPSKSNSAKKIGSNKKTRKRIEVSKIPIFVKNADDQPPLKVIEFKEASSKACSKREDKIGERRKKNMTLYKNGFQRTEKNEIIRGVRSNRRFDLQMIYRDSLR